MMKLKKALLVGLATTSVLGAVLAPTVPSFAEKNLFVGQIAKAHITANDSKNTLSKISIDEAKKIALNEAKTGKMIGIKFEDDDNNEKYEVTFIDNDQEKEYEIDATTGKIIKREIEDLDKEDKVLAELKNKVGMEEIEKIVKNRYSNEKIVEINLDVESGKAVYEMKFDNGIETRKLVLSAEDGAEISNTMRSDKKKIENREIKLYEKFDNKLK